MCAGQVACWMVWPSCSPRPARGVRRSTMRANPPSGRAWATKPSWQQQLSEHIAANSAHILTILVKSHDPENIMIFCELSPISFINYSKPSRGVCDAERGNSFSITMDEIPYVHKLNVLFRQDCKLSTILKQICCQTVKIMTWKNHFEIRYLLL